MSEQILPASPRRARAFLSLSAAGTRALAASLAAVLPPGCLLRLEGPLGAGKTTFVQGLAAGLGLDEPARSPSFGLLHVYGPPAAPRLVHLDLYRLGSTLELRELGLDAYLDGPAPIAVEWPQRVGEALPAEGLRVCLEEAQAAESESRMEAVDPAAVASDIDLPSLRRILLVALDAASADRLAAWQPPLGSALLALPPEAGDLAPAAPGLAAAGGEFSSASTGLVAPDLVASSLDPAPASAASPLHRVSAAARTALGADRARPVAGRRQRGPVLALDSASEQAGVALVDAAGRALARHTWQSRRRHTVELAPTVAEILAQAGVAAADLGAVAVTLGPGSYTGLRIALALAKGIALAAGCPVVGIPTLDLLAVDPRLLALRPVIDRDPAAGPAAASGRSAISPTTGAMTPPTGLWACMAAGRGRYLAAFYPWSRTAEACPGGRRPAAWPEPSAQQAQPSALLLARLAPGDLMVGELDEAFAGALADRGIVAFPLERDPVLLARMALGRLDAAPEDPLAALPAEALLAPLYAA